MRKTIFEQQTNPCGDPRTVVEAQSLGYDNVEPTDFNLSKYCFKVIAGKKWYKSKDGSPIVVSPTPPSTDNIFVGTYRAEKYFKDFTIEEQSGNLYWNTKYGKTALTKKSENTFTGKLVGMDYDVNFTVENGKVKGGKFIYSLGGIITEINFTKVDGSTPPIEEEDWSWKEIASSTYETLKKAGRWVKTEAGKFYAYVNSKFETKKTQDATWDCINKYNEAWGYYKLRRGGDFDDPWYFEYNDHEIDGKKTLFVYFSNHTFAIRFRNSTTNIPGQTGKWSCLEGGSGYKLNFDDGREAIFGLDRRFDPNSVKDNKSPDTENKSQVSNISEACENYSACPSFIDIVNKNLSYKKCMKCPEIEVYQKNPVLNVIYFRKLKQKGLPEKTDENFGPILESALLEYQEMNGIPKTGKIDAKTNKVLMRDSRGRQQ